MSNRKKAHAVECPVCLLKMSSKRIERHHIGDDVHCGEEALAGPGWSGDDDDIGFRAMRAGHLIVIDLVMTLARDGLKRVEQERLPLLPGSSTRRPGALSTPDQVVQIPPYEA